VLPMRAIAMLFCAVGGALRCVASCYELLWAVMSRRLHASTKRLSAEAVKTLG